MDAHNDDDASDGAWWGILEDSVEFFNNDNKTKYDPFESVHEYIQKKATEQEEAKKGYYTFQTLKIKKT